MASIFDTAENFFGAIGGNHPVGRFLIGAGFTVLLMEAVKPDFAYHPNGARRGASFFSSSSAEYNAFSDDGGAGETSIPFWLPPLVVGTAAATLI